MSAATLLQRLLAAKGKKERIALLNRHKPLNTALFQLIKEQGLEVAKRDCQEALRIAEVGLEAAEFAMEQEGVAYAWWARGNALLFLGRYDDCLTAYSTAISILAGLGRTWEVAQLQTNCMPPLMYSGRYAEAQAMGQSALETLTAQGDTKPVANLLLNLSACAIDQGKHAEAAAHAGQAADIFSKLGDVVQMARCWVTQALALENLDRFTEAETLLGKALQIFFDHEARMPWARTALNLGVLRARLADYQTALRWLEDGRRAFLETGNEMEVAVVNLYRIQCFLDVNLLPEAASLGKELVETFTQLKMPRQVARAASFLAEVYARRGQVAPARRELERARQTFHIQGDEVEVALHDLRCAELLRAVGRPGEASRLASQASRVLDAHRYPLHHAKAHLIIAACCENWGRIEEAQAAYQVAWEAGSHPTGTTEPPPMLAYRIAYARGAIAEAAGQRALARGEYGRAIGYLGKVTQGLGLDELRGGYLADKRPAYEAVMRLALDDGRLADAFRYSESARAGALRDFLARGRRPAAKIEEGDPSALEHLKARWAWRVSGLHRPVDLMAEAEEELVRLEDRSARLRELADLEREVADAYRRRRLADPRFAALEQGEVLELDDVRRQLPDGTALLSFDHVDNHLFVFVITRDKADVVLLDRLAKLRWDTTGLRHALDEVRLFDDPADLALLENELLEDLQALYQAVLAKPLARIDPEVHRLLIVPCAPLHTLPLEALHDGNRYLLDRCAVCYLPSASLLAALPEGRRVDNGSPLVMAHSWQGRLPLALEEAAGVAQVLANGPGGQPLLLVEEQATASTLCERAGKAGLVHIAAHGAFRIDAPLFSSLHLADGPFTVNEAYGLDLSQVALVTLSGCQTGLGKGHGGEMLGLTHAFFFAGAPALVVSRWRVEDEATARLMQDFYAAAMRGEPVAEALRMAQLGTLAYRPHASYWAAFATWGQGFEPAFTE